MILIFSLKFKNKCNILKEQMNKKFENRLIINNLIVFRIFEINPCSLDVVIDAIELI